MNRRRFLKFVGATPFLAAAPALAKPENDLVPYEDTISINQRPRTNFAALSPEAKKIWSNALNRELRKSLTPNRFTQGE